MSTVAYRDGVMAADTLGIASSAIPYQAKKLFRCNDGLIVGFVGSTFDGMVFLRWCEAGMDMENLPTFINYRGDSDAPSFHALVLTGDGVTEWTEHFQPLPLHNEFYAVGTGQVAAMTAMTMGKTAVEAVGIAAQMDINTGGEIDTAVLGRPAIERVA